MSEYPPRQPRHYDPSSSQPRTRNSVITSASGIADSTISFNTYATGITEGSLCLSQFPPPPMTIPSSASPTTERFLPSPVQSNFTVTATPHAGPSSDQGQSSPSTSMFTVTAPPRAGPNELQGQPSPSTSIFTIAAPPHVNPTSGSASPIVRPLLSREKPLPSPAQSIFTITSPVSTGTAPSLRAAAAQLMPSSLNHEITSDDSSSREPGKTERVLDSDPRVGRQSPNSIRLEGKLSPYDWHEGSSIISVDAAEERMLSTSFITELLSSSASIKSSVDQSPRAFHPPYQADVGSLVSEMSYPPASSRHREPVAGPSRIFPSSHPSIFPGQVATSRTDGEDDATTLLSYEGQAYVVQPSPGLTRKVSVLGMAPATLRHIGSTASVPESLHPRSQATYGSTSPLNPHPSEMDKMRPADIQPIGFPQLPTPERPVSLNFDKRSSLRYLRRESAQSSRTMRSHVTSLISVAGQRTVRAARATAEWMRIKPLPPLPTIPNISIHQAQQHRRMESSVPLPRLADRADRLNVMLDAGRLPHDSFRSSRFVSDKDSPFGARASSLRLPLGNRRRQSVNVRDSQSECSRSPLKPKSLFKRPVSRKAKIKLFIGASVLALLALIGIVVGVTVGRKRARTSSCSANRTGNTCSLDSTCVCTSSNTIQCNPLAQSLVSLVPFVNDQFDSNFTLATVVNALSSSGVSALSNDCAAQARVVDVAPALDSQTVPNRTKWAQGALLWSFVLSQNASAVGELGDFISQAPWSNLPGDGPVTGGFPKFSTTQLGFTFDFAAQTVSEPSVSFVTDGQPSSTQLAEVGSTARTALDRMYSFASASSTLQTTAITNYWQNVLGQDPSKFRTFVSLLISSPILIPFDATGTARNTSISSLLTNSTTAPFPPPLSCYPGLTQSQFQLITTVETSVFGLSSPATQANFNNSCFADRPIYGVLDILHLRLPFTDSQTRPKQAVILSRDVSPRVVVYNREILSGLPTSNTSTVPTTDPRQFGTLGHISHVLLDFFKAIPDVNVARQVVNYVLSSQVTPPSNDTLLGMSLNTIPTLEVAVFGSVTPQDVEGIASSFTTPSGGLFFGTDQSLALRDWAMIATHTSVTWTEFANSPTIVNDNSFTDNAFNAVWNPAYLFFHSNSDATVTVGNITAGFTVVNKFTST